MQNAASGVSSASMNIEQASETEANTYHRRITYVDLLAVDVNFMTRTMGSVILHIHIENTQIRKNIPTFCGLIICNDEHTHTSPLKSRVCSYRHSVHLVSVCDSQSVSNNTTKKYK